MFERLLYVIDRTVWHSAYLSDRGGTSAQYAHPCPLNRSSQNPLSCFRSRLLIICTSSSRFCTRASLFANLGSFASSGSFNTLSVRILNLDHVLSRLLNDSQRHPLPVCYSLHRSSYNHLCTGILDTARWRGAPFHAFLLLSLQLDSWTRCSQAPLSAASLLKLTDNRNRRHPQQTCVSNRLQSIQTPLPVCCRDMSAAIIAP